MSYETIERWQPDLQHPDGLHVLLYFGGGFVAYWLNCFIEVVVSTMYLRAREGEEPGGWQLGEAWRYRGFTTLAGGLLLRYIGWGLLVGLALEGVLLFADLFTEAANSGPMSGVGAVAGGVGHGFALVTAVIVVVGFVLVTTLIYCRYMFLFQMFAIKHGSSSGFLDECVARTKKAWKTAAVVMIAGMIPICLILGIESLAWKHWTPPHGVHLAVEVAGAILTGCFTAWFILVKTGLAIQLMTAPAAAIEPVGDGSAL